MHDLSRRAFILSSGAFAALGARPLPGQAPPSSGDALQQWLAEHAVAIRSIDATDEEYDDLEPLVDAIGAARVVQLGEPSHGAGSGFAAKVRLVKFLHRRMGFDVLAWESGLYDVQATQAGLRAGEDGAAAARRGILGIWSQAEQCRPLFDHARASHGGNRPLDMAGFDMQFTAEGSAGRFAADLHAFVDAVRHRTVRDRAAALAAQALDAFARINAYTEALRRQSLDLSRAGLAGASRQAAMAAWQAQEGAALRPQRADRDQLEQAAGALLALIARRRAPFERTHGARAVGFMAHAVANLRGYGVNLHEQYGADRPAGSTASSVDRENRRDALNAANLRWLIEHGYPGRKIIVWAHNAHVMNAYYGSDWSSVHLEPRDDAMKPSGVFLAEWLGDAVYTIGMTAHSGEDGWATGGAASPIAPAPAGSLEARLHDVGQPFAFLDFRALDLSPGHPLRNAQSMRVPKYEVESLADVTRPYDGIVFIDRMERATPIR